MRDAVARRRRQWLVPLCLRLQRMPYLFDQPSRQIVLVFVSLVVDLKDLCLPRGKPFKGAHPGLLQRSRVRVSGHQLVELDRIATASESGHGRPGVVVTRWPVDHLELAGIGKESEELR